MADITLAFPDGSKKKVKKGITGAEVAKKIGPKLAKAALAVMVDEEVYDLIRPIAKNAKIRILTWEDEEGKKALWHSAAHVFAHAINLLYPDAKNTIGPAIEDGFYYDFDDLDITPDDFEKIEKKMMEIAKQNLPFVRKDISMNDVNNLFPQNPYNKELAK